MSQQIDVFLKPSGVKYRPTARRGEYTNLQNEVSRAFAALDRKPAYFSGVAADQAADTDVRVAQSHMGNRRAKAKRVISKLRAYILAKRGISGGAL